MAGLPYDVCPMDTEINTIPVNGIALVSVCHCFNCFPIRRVQAAVNMAKYLLSMSLVCFFTSRIQANGCNFNPTHLVKHGYELKELPFWETKTKDVVKCAQSCIRRKKCKSFNFNVKTDLCQLNEKTGTPSKADNKLVYSEIGDWPSQVSHYAFAEFLNN